MRRVHVVGHVSFGRELFFNCVASGIYALALAAFVWATIAAWLSCARSTAAAVSYKSSQSLWWVRANVLEELAA